MPLDINTSVANTNNYNKLISISKQNTDDHVKEAMIDSGLFGDADDITEEINSLTNDDIGRLKMLLKVRLQQLAKQELLRLNDENNRKSIRSQAWQQMHDRLELAEEVKERIVAITINTLTESTAISDDQLISVVNAVLAPKKQTISPNDVTYENNNPRHIKATLPQNQGVLSRDASQDDGDVKYAITDSTLSLNEQAAIIAETFFHSFLEHEGLHQLYLHKEHNIISEDIKDICKAKRIEIKDVTPPELAPIIAGKLVALGFEERNINQPGAPRGVVSSSRATLRV